MPAMHFHPNVLAAAAALTLCTGAATAGTIEISPAEGNATPRVTAAVKAMKDGDTLRFKKGEYHFYEEGAIVKQVMAGATSWGEKKLVFGFEGRNGITVDGGGSTFVWHGNVFPFSFAKCRGVTVKNVVARAFRPSYVELKIDRYLEGGSFEFTFNPGVAYSVKDGALLIDTDLGRFDSREKIISIHALERMAIHYLFAANETTARDRLASTFLNGVAEDLGGGRVRVTNRPQKLRGCLGRFPFKAGEPLCFLLNGRERCSLHFAECRDVTVKDVHLQSGDGMGLVSFLNENLTVDGYRVEPREGEHVSITADCLFVVNNKGLVEVKNSTFSWALDDAMNMHGNYLRVKSSEGTKLELEHIHHSYYNFHPYHPGDTVEFTDPETRQVVATAKVQSVAERKNGAAIAVDRLDAPLAKGTLVENVTWLPEVRLHDNVFHDVLHVRLSGRGKYTVERNVFRRGIALLVNDLARYWGEAGRTEDMTIRDNLFDSFSARGGGGSFIVVEVDGRGGRELRIHRGIRITGNRVKGLPKGVPFVSAPCALDPVIEDNAALPASAAGRNEAWPATRVEIKSTLDGTLQPAWFWAPEKAKGEAVPLVVGHHSWSTDIRDFANYRAPLGAAMTNGWVFVGPNFRGPNNRSEACGGELAVQDVVDAVEWAKAHAKVDPERIYIIGASGGGHMALLMLGRHPEIFAAGVALCPITDIARWHADSLLAHPGRNVRYAKDIEVACGGKPAERPEEYARRSPLTWLRRTREAKVPVYVCTGIHDGWKGSVPVGHAIRAFNALADEQDRISEADIAFIEANRRTPAGFACGDLADPFYAGKNRACLRRTSANARLTLFEGAHQGNYPAAFDFLRRQVKGRPADWTLPAAGRGAVECIAK